MIFQAVLQLRHSDCTAYYSKKEGYVSYRYFIAKVVYWMENLRKTQEGQRVLVLVDRSSDSYAAILGAFLAQRTFTAVEASDSEQAIEGILRRLGADTLVLCFNGEDARYHAGGYRCEVAPRLSETRSFAETTLPVPDPKEYRDHEDKIAYIKFTSGSTGKPKGVLISRRALSHYLKWVAGLPVPPNARWAQVSRVSFDVSITDIFGFFIHGAALYPLGEDKDRLFPLDFIRTNQITVWNSVPSMWTLALSARKNTQAALTTLRLIIFLGETLFKRTAQELISSLHHEAIAINTYGPTEATVAISELRITSDLLAILADERVPIGRPFAQNAVQLEAGQLYISGPQLAAGYLNDEKLTAQKFSLLKTAQEVVLAYATGDLAEVAEEAHLDLGFRVLGRNDDQVKINGVRLELPDLNGTIIAAGATDCVSGIVDGALIAYISCSAEVTDQMLATAVRLSIAPEAVPQDFRRVRSLERSQNGKISFTQTHSAWRRYAEKNL